MSSREIKRAKKFEDDLKRLGKKHPGIADGVTAFLKQCAERGSPNGAVWVPGVGGLPVFKARLRLRNRGSRAGLRIICLCDSKTIKGLALYAKGEQANMPSHEIAVILRDEGHIPLAASNT